MRGLSISPQYIKEIGSKYFLTITQNYIHTTHYISMQVLTHKESGINIICYKVRLDSYLRKHFTHFLFGPELSHWVMTFLESNVFFHPENEHSFIILTQHTYMHLSTSHS